MMPADRGTVVVRWLAEPYGEALERQIDGIAGLPDVRHVAVMPDVHQGKRVPNGIVVATERLVYPELIGVDIGCGISAVRFQATVDRFRQPDLRSILEELVAVVPTLKQPAAVARQHQPLIDGIGRLSCDRLARFANRDGRFQLGTLGRGNHFLELASDSQGAVWAVVHTGSRAMGRHITSHYLNLASAAAGDLSSLDSNAPEGQAYLADMLWACRFATLSRQVILNRVADILERRFGIAMALESFVDSPHNIGLRQVHRGQQLLVHRKSANVATLDRQGLIAGSMLIGNHLVRGLGNPDSLHSSSHGAGRRLSRTEAAETLSTKDLGRTMRSVVWHDHWAHHLIDESPWAYRELHKVMAAQRDLVKTIDTLTPFLNDKRP